MKRLPTVPCPQCGVSLVSTAFVPGPNGGASRASGYLSCLRRCETCGIGFSNGNTADAARLAIIYKAPLSGLEDFLFTDCDSTLSLALNERHRDAKRTEFQSANSEDRVTWIVFRYLQHGNLLRTVLAQTGVVPAREVSAPTMLLWGVPVPNDHVAGAEMRKALVKVCDAIGENPECRSEPDVMLDFGDVVVGIEVKYRSGNEVKGSDYGGWRRYTKGTQVFSDAVDVRASGLYELARNWRIGCDLAGRRSLVLLNLGPATLLNGDSGERLKQFERSLSQQAGRSFHFVSWPQLLSGAALPEALLAYARKSGLVTTS